MRVLSLEDGLDDPGEYCCDQMKYQMVGTVDCRDPEGHASGTVQCPKQIVTYSTKLNEYCLSPVGLYTYLIHYCPWCGTKLPESNRLKPGFDLLGET